MVTLGLNSGKSKIKICLTWILLNGVEKTEGKEGQVIVLCRVQSVEDRRQEGSPYEGKLVATHLTAWNIEYNCK
jgi:hypothetical protein